MAIKKVVLCITVNRLNVSRRWENEHGLMSSMLEPATARITMWRTDNRTGIEEKAMTIEIELTKVARSRPLEIRAEEINTLYKPGIFEGWGGPLFTDTDRDLYTTKVTGVITDMADDETDPVFDFDWMIETAVAEDIPQSQNVDGFGSF